MQSERVQFDEQVRVKDVELNRLKSVKLELEQDLRDCRQTIDRVSHSLSGGRLFSKHNSKLHLVLKRSLRLDQQLGTHCF